MWSIKRVLFWLVLWGGAALIFWASKDYFLGSRLHPFLAERYGLYLQGWWRKSIYIHVFSGCLSLAASLLQYSNFFLKTYPRVHKSLGYIYVLSLLLAVIPTGLIISVVAKGGWAGQSGFFAMNALTLISVLLGLKAILKGKVREHQVWITRSFGLVTSAITFRVLIIVFITFDISGEWAYPLCVWLSMLINALVVEYYLYQTKSLK